MRDCMGCSVCLHSVHSVVASSDNCGAWVGDLSNDARQAWSSFASYLVNSGMSDDNEHTLHEYLAKSGKYASNMVKDTGMIAGNCFGSEWANCAEYGGRTGASAFSLYYDIGKAYKYCKTEANGGDPENCTEYILEMVWDTSATLWYALTMSGYCFEVEMEIIEEIVEEELEGEEEAIEGEE